MTTNHASNTIGGAGGHWLRRFIHVLMIAIPFVYYTYGFAISRSLHMTRPMMVIIILLIICALEFFRVCFHITIFGQRKHEAKHISSFAWGAFALGLVLLFAPGAEYGAPIIASCAIVDPVLGELRRFSVRPLWVALLGLVLIAVIWLLASFYFGTPVWLFVLMAPVTLVAEWPSIRWIDDNALMQLVPLVVVLVLEKLL